MYQDFIAPWLLWPKWALARSVFGGTHRLYLLLSDKCHRWERTVVWRALWSWRCVISWKNWLVWNSFCQYWVCADAERQDLDETKLDGLGVHLAFLKSLWLIFFGHFGGRAASCCVTYYHFIQLLRMCQQSGLLKHSADRVLFIWRHDTTVASSCSQHIATLAWSHVSAIVVSRDPFDKPTTLLPCTKQTNKQADKAS